MKKSLLVLCVLVLLLVCHSIALAEETYVSGLFTYEIRGNGTVTILDYDWSRSKGDVHVPNMLDGRIVTAIADEAFAVPVNNGYYTNSVLVTLPDTVTQIGERAFFNAPVSSINITENLRSIGRGALTTHGPVHFNIVPNQKWYAVIDNALYEKSTKTLIAITGDASFLRIPEGIKTIGAYACYNGNRSDSIMHSMGISVPATVTTIEAYAFTNASLNGEWDALPYGFTGVKRLGEGCFQNVLFHDALILPAGLTSIPAYAFQNASFFEFVILPNSITSIGDYAFSKAHTNYKLLRFHDDPFSCVKGIDWGSSSDMSERIHAIVGDNLFPTSLLTLGSYAFYRTETVFGNDPYLTFSTWNPVVKLPDELETIGEFALSSCGIGTCVVPVSVYDIHPDAFDQSVATLQIEPGSYAEAFAQENGFRYTYAVEEDLDWLLN